VTPPPQLKLKAWGRGHGLRGDKKSTPHTPKQSWPVRPDTTPRKTEARAAILRQLLKTYDDVVYRAHPSAATVVQRAAAALPGGGAARVHVRPYPPPTLAEVA
jgi:hypothetical protein